MLTKKYFVLRLFVTMFLSFCIGGCIILVLKAFHHSNWFAFLGGFFGITLFCTQVFIRKLFHGNAGNQHNNHPFHALFQIPSSMTYLATYIYIPLFGLLGLGAGVSLYFLTDEHPTIALLNAFLVLLILYSFWVILLSMFTIFVIRKKRVSQ